MKRASMILLLLAASAVSGMSQDSPRFSFGLEWGYSPTVFRSYRYVYRDDYGSTVSDSKTGFCYDGDFFLLAGAGIRMGEKSELSLTGGLMGIGVSRKGIPLLLKYKYADGGRKRDGALAFIDGGVSFPLNTSANKPAFTWRAGGGYRLILSDRWFLDFTAGFRVLLDHPCDKSSVRKNESFSAGPGIGVSLGF